MRILVVDDDVNGAETLRRMLVAQGGVVQVAHDGDAGFELAVSEPWDAIVLDIMMPGRNGYEVVRDLRRSEVWAPVLMLTAKDGDYDQIDAFDFGADDYLIKPFSFDVLSARLRALVRRGAPARPATLVCDDLTLDPGARTARRGDTELSLTPREFGILEMLLRHVDQAVSKAEIMRSVWDVNYEGDENVVEVYVSYLRRKVDTPFGRNTIQTVRGAGYRATSGS
ncbi:response regulator transcription factor [Gordonia sp. TBRC 11910]|uniref:Response regulator transcription factor n=1 Tax=Gordonia asplenii TaxID=2725283 RepID=A0A848KYP5_9ACTN|nr:response regulator transcription factor [Gordonia asplenii]NMO01975.1 response regulator transcription factor [Gordonia asplenii]